jgi:hypothetical protein
VAGNDAVAAWVIGAAGDTSDGERPGSDRCSRWTLLAPDVAWGCSGAASAGDGAVLARFGWIESTPELGVERPALTRTPGVGGG